MSGCVIIYTGDGEGKTMTALGHVLRALGHGMKVGVFFFLKGRDNIGEFQFLKEKTSAHVFLCGDSNFVIDEESKKNAQEKINISLENVTDHLKNQQYDLIVLDEILYATEFGLVSEKQLKSIIEIRGKTHLILTGGTVPTSIERCADIYTKFTNKFHHYNRDKKTINGIDW